MNPVVPVEGALECEAFSTVLAAEGFLSSVSASVARQVFLVHESLFALTALQRICKDANAQTRTQTHIHAYTHCIHTCIHRHIHTHTQFCVLRFLGTSLFALIVLQHMHTHTHMHTHMHTHTHAYTHTSTHTHTHTHTAIEC